MLKSKTDFNDKSEKIHLKTPIKNEIAHLLNDNSAIEN